MEINLSEAIKDVCGPVSNLLKKKTKKDFIARHEESVELLRRQSGKSINLEDNWWDACKITVGRKLGVETLVTIGAFIDMLRGAGFKESVVAAAIFACALKYLADDGSVFATVLGAAGKLDGNGSRAGVDGVAEKLFKKDVLKALSLPTVYPNDVLKATEGVAKETSKMSTAISEINGTCKNARYETEVLSDHMNNHWPRSVDDPDTRNFVVETLLKKAQFLESNAESMKSTTTNILDAKKHVTVVLVDFGIDNSHLLDEKQVGDILKLIKEDGTLPPAKVTEFKNAFKTREDLTHLFRPEKAQGIDIADAKPTVL